MPDELRRFFVEPGVATSGEVQITGDLARRLARVLRYRPGDRLVLATGAPREHVVELSAVSWKQVAGAVVGEQDGPEEPSVEVVLYQALIRPNRFDLVLEKGTEIGVAHFVPVLAGRTQVQMDEPGHTRAERWHRLIVEAAEQCGRGRFPEIAQPIPFADALASAPGLKIVPWEDEREQRLADYLRALPERPATVSIFVGPEGGYQNEEVALARDSGAALVTLGRQVMRAETAAVVAAGIVLHELDR